MRKISGIQLFTLVNAFLLFGFFGCQTEKYDFKRLELGDKNKNFRAEAIIKVKDREYFIKRQHSFKYGKYGHYLQISSKDLKFPGVYLTVYSEHENRLKIFQDKKVIKKQILKAGINEINFFVERKSFNFIKIRSQYRKKVFFSSVINYRKIPKNKRKYVFLICADTLSALHVDCYGYDKQTAPNMKNFLKDSILFKNAWANSSWTVSSHMSLFTSKYEYDHNVRIIREFDENLKPIKKYIIPLSGSIPFLVEALSKHFIAISYNGGGNVSPEFGFFRGFDLYSRNSQDLVNPRASEFLFRKTLENLKKNAFPKGFYFLHTYHVHSPYNPPEAFWDELTRKQKYKIFTFDTDFGGKPNIYSEKFKPLRNNMTNLYDSEIRAFDFYFGKFIKFLKQYDIYDSAMIILLSDHGEGFFEHGVWYHGTSLYEEQIKIPLIIKLPGNKFQGKIVKENVSLLDIMPTILDYYGLKTKQRGEGESLLKIMRKENNSRIIFSSLYNSKHFVFAPKTVSAIYQNYKIIYNEPSGNRAKDFFNQPPPDLPGIEIFNLNTDGKEKHNLISNNFPEKAVLINYLNSYIEKVKRRSKLGKKHRDKMSKDLEKQLKSLGYLD